MGARPMARKINTLIKVPLSKKILFEKIQSGSIVTVDFVGDEVTFSISQTIKAPTNQPMVDKDGFIQVPVE
jgi:ATP-dependent Clp protease ATP-binding subunit ClpA